MTTLIPNTLVDAPHAEILSIPRESPSKFYNIQQDRRGILGSSVEHL